MIKPRHSVGTYRFPRDVKKLARMQRGAEADARRPFIRRFAVRLTRSFPPDAWADQVREIHRFVRDSIRYVHDPNRQEDLQDAKTVLDRGFDDCDGKVRVAVALARALGIHARVHPIWGGPVLDHVQAAYRWPGSERYPGANAKGWVVGDVTIKGAELGQDPKRTIPRNTQTGRLPLS